jgi:hypothetical protein
VQILEGGIDSGLGDSEIGGELGFDETLSWAKRAIEDLLEDGLTDLLDFREGGDRLHGHLNDNR